MTHALRRGPMRLAPLFSRPHASSLLVAAVALGACVIERHLTLDRAMWGSDQAASIEPHGFERLVKDITAVERALGDGIKRVYASEVPAMDKLRKVRHLR